VLSHFCFTGSHVYAYNDQIGMLAPLKTDFKGGVSGEVFMGMLRQSRAVEIELHELDGVLQIKMGLKNPTKVKLGLLPPDEFAWVIPKAQPDKVIDISKKVKEFRECVESVMHSVSGDTTIPDQLGVTFVSDGDGVSMYSTDHHSMSHAHFKLSKKWPVRVILPSAFCNLIYQITAGRTESFTLEVYHDYVRAMCDGIMIYSRVIESERPFDFKGEFADLLTSKAKSQSVPIPSKIKLILERACIISDSKEKKNTSTSITAREGKLNFYCFAQDRGEVIDSSQIGEGHPDAKIDIEARHLRSVFDAYHTATEGEENGKLYISAKCVVLSRANMTYILSASAKQK
jgi:DNA polymerase III sliding clamp (beta) subunit (PCNA family)